MEIFMRRLLLTTNILVAGLFTSPLALADSVQMLPPTVSGTPTVCSGGSTVLTYTGDNTPGHSGINCVPVIIDSGGSVTTNRGNVGIGTDNPNSSLDLSHRTDAVSMPSGTTAEQPSSPVEGMTRYNNQIHQLEFWNGGNWLPVATSPTLGLQFETPSCRGVYTGHDNAYGCMARCSNGYTATGGGFQEGAVFSGNGRNSIPYSDGYFCEVNINVVGGCSSGPDGPPPRGGCNMGCFAVCVKVVD